MVNQKDINLEFKTHIDSMVFQLSLMYPTLSKNERKLVVLFKTLGLNKDTKKIALKRGIFKSNQSINNHLTVFRKLGIIDKNNTVLLKQDLLLDTIYKLNVKVKVGS